MAHCAHIPAFVLHQVTCQFATGQTLFGPLSVSLEPVSYTHLRAHETRHDLVCRLLLEKKKKKHKKQKTQYEKQTKHLEKLMTSNTVQR